VASSAASLLYGSVKGLFPTVAAKVIDQVATEIAAEAGHWRSQARILCSELEHLARCDAGGKAFLERLPEIRRALGL